MELVERPYFDDVFVTNIEGKALSLVMDAIEEIPGIDTDLVRFSYGVWNNGNVARANETLSIWVNESIDTTLFRNRLYQAILRIQTEDMAIKGEIFDKNNVWYPIFREASLMAYEWHRVLKAVIRKHETNRTFKINNDYENEPEYIVAKDLFERYKDELEKNPYYLYELLPNEDKTFVDREESGWILEQTGFRTLEEDITRIVMCTDDTEDIDMLENMDIDSMVVFG